MEPALPLPLRLDISHPSVPTEHAAVSDAISHFLTSYAARTGTSNAASSSDDTATGSTGGVVAAQLTRLMNGLAGKIDYDAFTLLTSSAAAVVDDDDDELMVAQQETPAEVLDSNPPDGDTGDGIGTESFSKTQELQDATTPTIDSSLRSNPMDASPRKKKDKKDKKERKDKKLKKEATA